MCFILLFLPVNSFKDPQSLPIKLKQYKHKLLHKKKNVLIKTQYHLSAVTDAQGSEDQTTFGLTG